MQILDDSRSCAPTRLLGSSLLLAAHEYPRGNIGMMMSLYADILAFVADLLKVMFVCVCSWTSSFFLHKRWRNNIVHAVWLPAPASTQRSKFMRKNIAHAAGMQAVTSAAVLLHPFQFSNFHFEALGHSYTGWSRWMTFFVSC